MYTATVRFGLAAALIGAALIVASDVAAATLPGGAKPASVADIKALWSDKTRPWGNHGNTTGANYGARYYAANGKVTEWQATGTVGNGTWEVSPEGRACHTISYLTKADHKFKRGPIPYFTECWDYAQLNGDLYERWAMRQNNSPDTYKVGEASTNWGLIRHARPDPNDGVFRMFTAGDQVAQRMKENIASYDKDPPAPAAVVGARLRGADIQKALFGRTQTGENSLGIKFTTVVAADGTFTTAAGATGVSRVSDDKSCYRGSGRAMQVENCYAVHRNGNQYFFLFPDGSIANRFTLN
jgi:hypothetical protein